MGTEVLRPQDRLAERDRIPFAPPDRRRNLPGNLIENRKGNCTGHRKVSPKSNQKKMNKVTEAKKPTSAKPQRKYGVTNSSRVMGQVTLLRRGESLNSLTNNIKGGDAESTSPNKKPVEALAVRESNLIEPVSPLMVLKQINLKAPNHGYAGSTFYTSPSPRSVPLPSFFIQQQLYGKIKSFDDSATS